MGVDFSGPKLILNMPDKNLIFGFSFARSTGYKLDSSRSWQGMGFDNKDIKNI